MKKTDVGKVAIFLIATLSLLWWHTPTKAAEGLRTYVNTKYAYSLKFPRAWHIGYLGDSEKTANVTWFVSDKWDVKQRDGGEPLGVKVEIIVQDFQELRKMDPRFPDIKSAKDWLAWQRSGYSKLEREGKTGEADFNDTKVTVAGKPAIQTVDKKEPSIRVVVYSSDRIYQIQYLGREPAYAHQTPVFEQILRSFQFR